MDFRYHIDPDTDLPHIYGHGVTEDEAEYVLRNPGEDRAGRDGSRHALGQTMAGRYLHVIYVPETRKATVYSSLRPTTSVVNRFRRTRGGGED
jgi:hypothetical protein